MRLNIMILNNIKNNIKNPTRNSKFYGEGNCCEKDTY